MSSVPLVIKYILLLAIPFLLSLTSCNQRSGLSQGEEILHAIWQENTVRLKKAIQGLPPEAISGNLLEGRSPLVLAVESESFVSLGVLLDSGADPCIESASGVFISGKQKKPLIVAARYAYYDAIVILLEHQSSSCYTKLDKLELIRTVKLSTNTEGANKVFQYMNDKGEDWVKLLEEIED